MTSPDLIEREFTAPDYRAAWQRLSRLADEAGNPRLRDGIDRVREVMIRDPESVQNRVSLERWLAAGDLLPGRIYLCGGGSRLPQSRRSAAATRARRRPTTRA